MKELTDKIRSLSIEAGFEKIGITPADQPQASVNLESWLQKGYHGGMSWMQRYSEKRSDIKKFFPAARSVVCVAHNYFTPVKHSGDNNRVKVSRYAWGRDYHKIIKKKLKNILAELKQIEPGLEGRICVDTAPFMDKLWAQQAGLGWQGKHTNLITRDMGSWVFLGELILNCDLLYDRPAQDMCGTCSACIEACPTDAIIAPYILDSRRCISFLTIENRGEPIPEALADKMERWVFGCDICQEVCPWNRFQKETDEQAYHPRGDTAEPQYADLLRLDEAEFKEKFRGTPVMRAGWRDFLRNVRSAMRKEENDD